MEGATTMKQVNILLSPTAEAAAEAGEFTHPDLCSEVATLLNRESETRGLTFGYEAREGGLIAEIDYDGMGAVQDTCHWEIGGAKQNHMGSYTLQLFC